MARKKWSRPHVTAVIRKPKPGRAGEPKQWVDHHFDNLFMRTAQRTRRRRQIRSTLRSSFRARMVRMPGLADRFFRLFSLFLVCLVLFAAVTGASYSTYERGVSAVYTFTETVSDVATATLRTIMNTTDYIGTQIKQESLKDGDKCIIAVKIKGLFYEFECTFRDKGVLGEGLEKFVIDSAYSINEHWVGKEFICVLGFISCPDHGIRSYRIFEYKGE